MPIKSNPAMLKASIFICLLFFIHCKPSHFTPYEYEGKIIVIGTGGGFTGQVREYTILENGQVFSGTSQEGFVKELPRLEKKDVVQIFRNYDELNFAALEIDKPGNMYHYLIMKNENGNHKIQWGAYDSNAPRELLIYFANLKKQVARGETTKQTTNN